MAQKTLVDTSSSKYSFKWYYGNRKNGPAFIELISEEYTLKTKVSGIGYKGLVFVVTDTETGLEYYENFNLELGTATGSGLIVVDTKDEVTSRFNEIQNMYVSPLSPDTNKILWDVLQNYD